ncbi:unnamed protein product [Pylaiella littoralis]
MSKDSTTHAPLIPMSEIFMPGTGTDESEDHDHAGSNGHALSLIESEISHLTGVQATNNDEIKKRLTEIQALRESNLVVAGALGGLRKIKDKL